MAICWMAVVVDSCTGHAIQVDDHFTCMLLWHYQIICTLITWVTTGMNLPNGGFQFQTPIPKMQIHLGHTKIKSLPQCRKSHLEEFGRIIGSHHPKDEYWITFSVDSLGCSFWIRFILEEIPCVFVFLYPRVRSLTRALVLPPSLPFANCYDGQR